MTGTTRLQSRTGRQTPRPTGRLWASSSQASVHRPAACSAWERTKPRALTLATPLLLKPRTCTMGGPPLPPSDPEEAVAQHHLCLLAEQGASGEGRAGTED